MNNPQDLGQFSIRFKQHRRTLLSLREVSLAFSGEVSSSRGEKLEIVLLRN